MVMYSITGLIVSRRVYRDHAISPENFCIVLVHRTIRWIFQNGSLLGSLEFLSTRITSRFLWIWFYLARAPVRCFL